MKRAYLCLFLEEEQEFLVFVPDLPGCYSVGDNLPEAREMAKEVMGISVEETLRVREAVPEPRMSTLAEAIEWFRELMNYPLDGETDADREFDENDLHIEMIEVDIPQPAPVSR